MAFLILLIQAQQGFAIKDSLPTENAALKREFEREKKRGDPLTEAPPAISVHFTTWYYLSFFLLPVAA